MVKSPVYELSMGCLVLSCAVCFCLRCTCTPGLAYSVCRVHIQEQGFDQDAQAPDDTSQQPEQQQDPAGAQDTPMAEQSPELEESVDKTGQDAAAPPVGQDDTAALPDEQLPGDLDLDMGSPGEDQEEGAEEGDGSPPGEQAEAEPENPADEQPDAAAVQGEFWVVKCRF